MSEEKIVIYIEIDREDLCKLRRIASRFGCSLSEAIVWLVKQYDLHTKQKLIRKKQKDEFKSRVQLTLLIEGDS